MRVCLYGRVRLARGDEEWVPGGPKQRGVLALLALAGGAAVHADRLVDGLWEGDGPADPAASLRVSVSNLRKALHDIDPEARDHVVGRYPLYHLAPGLPSDLAVAKRLRFTAIGMMDADPTGAAGLLRRARRLLDGPPLADLLSLPFAAGAVATLEDARDALEDDLAQALSLGLAPERALEPLAGLVAAAPHRDARVLAHARALVACGRGPEAVDVLDRFAEQWAGNRPSDAWVSARASAGVAPETSTAVARTPLPVGLAAHVPRVWAGRVEERRLLAAEFDAFRLDRTLRIVEVTGVGGAGKTALAASAAGDLARRGAEVLHLGWTHSLGASLQPLLDAGLLSLGSVDALGPASDAASQIAVALRARGADATLLLVVDDVHWATGSAHEALDALVADPTLPVMVLLLRRPEPRGRELAVDPAVPLLRIALGPLTDVEVDDLLDQLSPDGPAGADESPQIRGSALPWVVDALARGGPRAEQRRRLERCLDALDPTTASLADALGLDPGGLSLRTLASVVGAPPAEVLHALRLLVADGLVAEIGTSPTRYRLSHDSVRDLVAERLGPSGQTELAAALHDALAATEEQATLRLHHALTAVDLLGEEAETTIAAATDELLAAGLYGDVTLLAERLAMRGTRVSSHVRGQVRVAAVFARCALGDGNDATGALLDHARRAARDGDWDLVVRALRFRNLLGHALTEDPDEDALVAAARDALAADPDTSLRTAFKLEWLHYMGLLHAGRGPEDLSEAVATIDALAHEAHDPTLLGRASHVRHQIQTLVGGPPREPLATTMRTLRYAREAEDVGLEVLALNDLVFDHCNNHDLESAADVAEALCDGGDPRGRWFGALGRAMLTLGRGEVARARDEAAVAHAMGLDNGIPTATESYMSQLFAQGWAAGELAEMVGFFAEQEWREPSGAIWGAAHAVCLVDADRSAEAGALAHDVAVHVDSLSTTGWLDLVVHALLAEVADAADRPDVAALVGPHLERWATGRAMIAAAVDAGPVDRYRALCARLLGDEARAEQAFTAAASQAGCRLWTDRIAQDLAR